MRIRGLLALPVLLIAALALALGSVGTATAGGLTKSAVKKIATKVVAKNAPTLSVTHASTADAAKTATTAGSATTASTAGSAQMLAGQAPAAFQNQVQVITVSVTTSSTSITVPIALSTGNYLLSYSAYLDSTGGPGHRSSCYFGTSTNGAPETVFAETNGTYSTGDGHSGTGYVVAGPGVVLALHCNSASAAFTTAALEPIQITALKVDQVTSTTSTS